MEKMKVSKIIAEGPETLKNLSIHNEDPKNNTIYFNPGLGSDECVIMDGFVWVSKKPNFIVRFFQRILLGWKWK